MTDKANNVLHAARTITDIRDCEAHMFEKDKDWTGLGIILCLCSTALVCGFGAMLIWAAS